MNLCQRQNKGRMKRLLCWSFILILKSGLHIEPDELQYKTVAEHHVEHRVEADRSSIFTHLMLSYRQAGRQADRQLNCQWRTTREQPEKMEDKK